MVPCLQKIPSLAMSAFFLCALGGCTFGPTYQVSDYALAPSKNHMREQNLYGWGPAIILPDSGSSYKKETSHAYDPYVLDTGDHLRILIYREPELSHTYAVDQEGFISLPLVGSLKARGKTSRELGQLVRARLIAEGYLKDPQISVEVEKNRPFFIYGSVRNAGQYPFVSHMSAETAVAIAGGLTDRGIDRMFRITRRTHGFIEKKDVPPDYFLMPGDIVYVYSGLF